MDIFILHNNKVPENENFQIIQDFWFFQQQKNTHVIRMKICTEK